MPQRVVQGQMVHPGVQAKGTNETAVYRLYDANDRLLYVGMGRNPMGRWSSHADQHAWWPSVVRFEVTWYPNRREAAAEERRALKEDDTVHNIHGTPKWGAYVSQAQADSLVHGNKAHRDWRENQRLRAQALAAE